VRCVAPHRFFAAPSSPPSNKLARYAATSASTCIVLRVLTGTQAGAVHRHQRIDLPQLVGNAVAAKTQCWAGLVSPGFTEVVRSGASGTWRVLRNWSTPSTRDYMSTRAVSTREYPEYTTGS
jgi:hypothetical protein